MSITLVIGVIGVIGVNIYGTITKVMVIVIPEKKKLFLGRSHFFKLYLKFIVTSRVGNSSVA